MHGEEPTLAVGRIWGTPWAGQSSAQTSVSFWGLGMGAVSPHVSGVQDGRVCLLQILSGCLVSSGWRRRGFQGCFVLPPPPLQKEGHRAADPTAPRWPSCPPEEVASGLARVLPEVWKSPQATLPPHSQNSPGEQGVLLLPCLRQRVRPRQASRRWWHSPSLIFPQVLPLLSPVAQCPLGTSSPQGRGPSRTPHAWPSLSGTPVNFAG